MINWKWKPAENWRPTVDEFLNMRSPKCPGCGPWGKLEKVGKIALLLGCLPFIFVAVITFLIAVSPLIGYNPIFGGSIFLRSNVVVNIPFLLVNTPFFPGWSTITWICLKGPEKTGKKNQSWWIHQQSPLNKPRKTNIAMECHHVYERQILKLNGPSIP